MNILQKFSEEFNKRHDFDTAELNIFLNRWKNKSDFKNIPEAWIIPLDTMMFKLNKINKNPSCVRQEFGQLIVGFYCEDVSKAFHIVEDAKKQIENIDKDLYQVFDINYIKSEITLKIIKDLKIKYNEKELN